MEPVTVALRAVPDAVSIVRPIVTAWAATLGVEDRTVERIGLAVTEAVGNVAIHAYRESDEPGEVRVTVGWRGEDLISVTVSDDGLGMVPRVDSPGLGVGLPLIAQMATRVDIRSGRPRGVEIQMSFEVPSDRAAAA